MGKLRYWFLAAAVCGFWLARSAAAAESAGDAPGTGDTGARQEESVSVSYVTLRNRTSHSVPAEYFGGLRGELRAGVCTVSFSPVRGLEEIAEAVPFYIPDEKIELTGVTETPLERFFSEVESFMQGDNGSIVIYIHGYNIDFEKSCRRSAIFQRALGLQDRLLLFSWPADGNMLKYTWDESDLYWTVPHLARFIEKIVGPVGKEKVAIVAHSLGARGAVQALARIAYRELPAPILNELVLIAPDIDTDIFLQDLPLVRETVGRITLYASDRDKALKLSHEVHGYPRLGMAGEYLSVLEGVETIDISLMGNRRLSGHLYHLFNPEVVEDLTRLLKTGEPAGSRPGLEAVENNGLPYWRMTP